MSIRNDRRLRTNPAASFVALVLTVALVAGCSGSDDGDAGPTTAPATASTTTIPITDAVDQVPQPSAEDAVRAVLQAEQDGDHAASFAVLSDAARRLYRDQAEWQDRRNELPPITGFEVEESRSEQVIVRVEHAPSLDPFLGLSAAVERQEWTAVPVEGGWLVDAEPETDYVLPGDDAVEVAALAWVAAARSCDAAAIVEQQALPTLYGDPSKVAELCDVAGTATAGTVGNLEAGPASADIVAQYSSDALIWARTVPITISGASLTLSLAPIGDVWKVMGVSD